MEITHIEPSNIIEINPDAEKELEILKAARSKKFPCSGIHRQIEVDSRTRTIVCTKCEHTVDPFDYLLARAMEGDRLMSGLKGIEIRTSIARAEFERLEKQIDNIRGKLKREGFPQPQVERNAYRNELANAESSHWAATEFGQ